MTAVLPHRHSNGTSLQRRRLSFRSVAVLGVLFGCLVSYRQTTNYGAIRRSTATTVKMDFVASTISLSFPPPKVVLLPGPHKSGSTSLQTCMVDWTHNWLSDQRRHSNKNHMLSLNKPYVLPGWAWAVPTETVLQEAKLMHHYPTKAFASLLGIVDRDPMLGIDPDYRKETVAIANDKVLKVQDLYKTAKQDAWKRGWKIIYGS